MCCVLCLYRRGCGEFESTLLLSLFLNFTMFVPSLSWQNDRFYIQIAQQKAPQTLITSPKLTLYISIRTCPLCIYMTLCTRVRWFGGLQEARAAAMSVKELKAALSKAGVSFAVRRTFGLIACRRFALIAGSCLP